MGYRIHFVNKNKVLNLFSLLTKYLFSQNSMQDFYHKIFKILSSEMKFLENEGNFCMLTSCVR